jgi:hypothetical protein
MPRILASEYPHPRYDRPTTGAVGLLGAAGIDLPLARFWTFQLREATAAQRGVVVSPRFGGPGIIKEFTANYSATAPGGQSMNLEMYQSQSAGVAGPNQAAATQPPGASIYEMSFSSDGGFTTPTFPGIFLGDQTQGGVQRQILNKLVTDDYWVLNVSTIARGAGGYVVNGMVRIYERVPLELLAQLMAD